MGWYNIIKYIALGAVVKIAVIWSKIVGIYFRNNSFRVHVKGGQVKETEIKFGQWLQAVKVE